MMANFKKIKGMKILSEYRLQQTRPARQNARTFLEFVKRSSYSVYNFFNFSVIKIGKAKSFFFKFKNIENWAKKIKTYMP